MIIEKKDIELLIQLAGINEDPHYPRLYLYEVLKQAEIFHYLMAIKIIKNEPIPELKEISEKLEKLLIDSMEYCDKCGKRKNTRDGYIEPLCECGIPEYIGIIKTNQLEPIVIKQKRKE